jgi:hypothetical protein
MEKNPYNIVPIISLLGWSGNPQGWLVYFPNWRKTKDINIALIDLFSTKKSKERERIMRDIVKVFYGGEHAFMQYKREIVNRIPSVTEIKNIIENSPE